MSDPELIYGKAAFSGGSALPVSIYADRPHVRAMMQDDAEALGCRVVQAAGLESLFAGTAVRPGPVVLLDCPEIDGARLGRLAELDMEIARQGGHLIVSTTLGALDAVFGCLDQSDCQVLIDPTPTERSLALGQVILRHPQHRVNELSEESRLLLLRLAEQVSQMTARLDRLLPPSGESDDRSAFRLESPRPAFAAQAQMDGSERLVRKGRAPTPDPRLVRQIIRQRQLRGKFFAPELFADPAWDMLLDLTAARAEHLRVSVTSLCIVSAVPPTTALRWIGQLTEAGLVQRVEDERDRRRAFIALTDKAADGMAQYFAEVFSSPVRVV